MTKRISNFPPIVGGTPRILILGSAPGEESLRQNRYYAHSRNLFWPLMSECLAIPPVSAPYAERVSALIEKGIALWDVYEEAERLRDGKPTSSDSDIRDAKFSDIAGLIENYPTVKKILLNGKKAEKAFLRYRKATDSQFLEAVAFRYLPSTSPANAAIPYDTKKHKWAAALASL